MVSLIWERRGKGFPVSPSALSPAVVGVNVGVLVGFGRCSIMYVLWYWDYDYSRFLDDAIENGILKAKYRLRKEKSANVSEDDLGGRH